MKVVHCKKEYYDVLIDRSTIFGNPFIIGKDGNRNQVIQKYKEWIYTQSHLLEEIKKLKGKILGCWCNKNQNCHGHVIIDIIKMQQLEEEI